jgi:hypothetical protein
MQRDIVGSTGRLLQRGLFALAIAMSIGCGDDSSQSRAIALAAPAARHLIGAWKVSFWIDPQSTVGRNSSDTSAVTGTIVLAEDTYGRAGSNELDSPTHDGVYDIDFSKFGFAPLTATPVPGVLARIVPHSPTRGSLFVVLSPETHWFTVQMNGDLNGDTVLGVWSAWASRSGGSSGRFVMSRSPQ